MIRAVFLDYTGTIIQFRGLDIDEMFKRVVEHSSLKSKDEAIAWWLEKLREVQRNCYGDNFKTEDELCMDILDIADEELGLKMDHNVFHTLMQNFWMYAPLYNDVNEFFDLCPVPIYILMDNSGDYAKVGLRRNRLHAHGIISGEDVKAYKPRKEIFEKALEIADCKPDEVVHIGDDLEGDVQGAIASGIQPILLDRKSNHRDAKCKRVRSLIEVLPYINQVNSEK